jgi:N-methylhydantoinase B/oxoprolinase/acetone carboxylase alpha subunit
MHGQTNPHSRNNDYYEDQMEVEFDENYQGANHRQISYSNRSDELHSEFAGGGGYSDPNIEQQLQQKLDEKYRHERNAINESRK